MADDVKAATVDDDTILDDIEDLPEFTTPPSGAYLVSLDKGIEEKKINNEPYYDVQMVIKSLVSVPETGLHEGEKLPKEGDMFNFIFNRANEFGMGNFKKFCMPIREKFGARTVGEIKEKAKGLEMLIVLKRKAKKDKQKNVIEGEYVLEFVNGEIA